MLLTLFPIQLTHEISGTTSQSEPVSYTTLIIVFVLVPIRISPKNIGANTQFRSCEIVVTYFNYFFYEYLC